MTEAQQKEMGARVAQLRDKQGFTNESLARRAQLSVKTVSRFVHGKHEPRTNTIEALAKALGVPEREIRGAPPSPFGETPDPFPASDGDVLARLDRIEESIAEAVAERDQQANEVRRLLNEQSELLATIKSLLGMDEEVTLQDHLSQEVRDALLRSAPPYKPTDRP